MPASTRSIALRSTRRPVGSRRWPNTTSASVHSTSAARPTTASHSATRPIPVSATVASAPVLSARSASPNATCAASDAMTRFTAP